MTLVENSIGELVNALSVRSWYREDNRDLRELATERSQNLAQTEFNLSDYISLVNAYGESHDSQISALDLIESVDSTIRALEGTQFQIHDVIKCE